MLCGSDTVCNIPTEKSFSNLVRSNQIVASETKRGVMRARGTQE